jgi:hypothetical protein
MSFHPTQIIFKRGEKNRRENKETTYQPSDANSDGKNP